MCSEEPISTDGAVVRSDGGLHLHLPPDPLYRLGLTSKGILGVCVARSLYPQMGHLSVLKRGYIRPPPLTPCTRLGLTSKGILGVCVARSLYPQMGRLSTLMGGSTSTRPPPPPDPLYRLKTHLKREYWASV